MRATIFFSNDGKTYSQSEGEIKSGEKTRFSFPIENDTFTVFVDDKSVTVKREGEICYDFCSSSLGAMQIKTPYFVGEVVVSSLTFDYKKENNKHSLSLSYKINGEDNIMKLKVIEKDEN